jgi:hypothetical protein
VRSAAMSSPQKPAPCKAPEPNVSEPESAHEPVTLTVSRIIVACLGSILFTLENLHTSRPSRVALRAEKKHQATWCDSTEIPNFCGR